MTGEDGEHDFEGEGGLDLTPLVIRMGDDPDACNEVFRRAYDYLRDRAQRYMGGQQVGHTLEASALVNEAFLKLSTGGVKNFNGSAHFFATAALAMRGVLVDHARKRNQHKRKPPKPLQPIEQATVLYEENFGSLLDLDSALDEFQKYDEKCYKVALLRIFGGLSHRDIGELLGLDPKTAERNWSYAKRWLKYRMR